MKLKGTFWFLLALLSWALYPVAAQNPALADSLIEVYQGEPRDNEMELLKTIATNLNNPDKKLKYSEMLISKAAEDSVYEFLQSGYLQRGNALQLKGNFAPALDSYFISLNYSNLMNDHKGIGAAHISIANTYSIIGRYQTAERYYERGIEILREVNDSITLGSALVNAGDDSFNRGKYDEALEYYLESGLIFQAIDYPLGQGYNLGNVGMVYAAQGKHALAKENMKEAIEILEKIKDYYAIAAYLSTIADIYAQQKNIPAAFDYAKRSHELATRYGLKDQIGDSNLQLAKLYEAAGNYKEAYNAYKNYIVYRDSVSNLETIQQMAEVRTNYEISQKQTEVDLLAQQKANQKIIVISTGIAFVLLGLL
ncbi:MAG TPA: tetratricopeptide repeat protein, partial [Gillisia sp.]|nr:tetratricopeptide repeat protein [Gillisia sp.]